MDIIYYLQSKDTLFYVEWSSTLLGLVFIILIIKENVWGWLFGIISSALSVYLFYNYKLYSETILYFLYTLFGVYGWLQWNKKAETAPLKINTWSRGQHAKTIGIGLILAMGLGYLFKTYTDADKSFIDAQTSIFGLIATYLEAHKILGGWIYWIIINAVTIWLYWTKGLEIYTWLMVVYFILSFMGYYQWRKRYKEEQLGSRK